MTKTADIAFPSWSNMENGVRISSPDRMALYFGNGSPKINPGQSGEAWSVVFIGAPDVVEYTFLFNVRNDINNSAQYIVGIRMTDEGNLEARSFNGSTVTVRATYTMPVPITPGQPLHIVWTERRQSGDVPSQSRMYVNGQLAAEDNTDFNYTGQSLGYISCESQMVIGAVRLYDYYLTPSQVLTDYIRASGTANTDFNQVSSLTISGVQESEFNGTFTEDNSLSMTSATEGTFKILSAEVVSSFPVDNATGLPSAGTAQWGQYCTFSEEGDATRHSMVEIVSATPIPPVAYYDHGFSSVVIRIADTGTFTSSGKVTIRGLVNPRDASLSGFLQGEFDIVSVDSTSQFTVEMAGLYTDVPYITSKTATAALDYPRGFDTAITIPGSDTSPQTIISPVTEGLEYTVRVRGKSKEGRVSDWIDDSLIIGKDSNIPLPIYFSVRPYYSSLFCTFDFSKDLTGAVDESFHQENNLGYIEVTACTPTTDRGTSTQDPGPDSGDDRTTLKIAVTPDANNLRQIYTEIALNKFEDQYLWARLVSSSGVASEWFPNDNGIASERDRFNAVPVLRGLGPYRPTIGNTNNLLPSGSSSDNPVDTSSSDGSGPGASNGSGGFFTEIP